MALLIRVGFFREMPHGEPSDPSVREAAARAPQPMQEFLAAYLAGGHLYRAVPGLVRDVLDNRTLIGPPHYLTDGTYVWPADAAYYVKTYNVQLPAEFVAHAEVHGFRMPATIDVSTLRME